MANRRRKKVKSDHMVLHLILLVALVLVLFEGRFVSILLRGGEVTVSGHMVTAGTSDSAKVKSSTVTDQAADASKAAASGSDASAQAGTTLKAGAHEKGTLTMLAGLPSLSGAPLSGSGSESSGQTSSSASAGSGHSTVSNPDSPAIVPYTEPPVDDSYFSDAVFIGDSRMEGFRNVSGITQGRFFTSVGMSLDGLISKNVIQTEQGNITVAAAVSGGVYKKIYLMLGTNDLGETDMDNFHDRFTTAAQRLMEIQPGAIMYVCSIIYVEEAKAANSQYVNNTNADRLNAILLQICEEHGYHYLNLNEFLSDGNGSLIAGASSDGVHLYEKYCEQMLEYLKCHYIPVEESGTTSDSSADAAADSDSGSQNAEEDTVTA